MPDPNTQLMNLAARADALAQTMKADRQAEAKMWLSLSETPPPCCGRRSFAVLVGGRRLHEPRFVRGRFPRSKRTPSAGIIL